ncbi:GNAT family N-acyltransferase [Sulfurimonas sp. C5]|uniref:GNAT family N-acyltransferase n=1 Tax=Sulfurimonas sp. C5 TaxID=3036947 RepID=UPI0024570E2A|nr:GNAT family N-acyltransferase [Sulfurimonas sp. C5]MDH4944334.1 GNAT family N-acyltransferase [Sulfurimonas sp. C5]
MINVEKLLENNYENQLKKLPPWSVKLLVSGFKKLFCEKKLNKIDQGKEHLRGLEFTDNLLDGLGITYRVKPKELQNIPATGRLIVIANHPTGMQDSFSLVQLIANAREDKKVKLLINSMLYETSKGFGWGIPVDVRGGISKTSLQAINETLENEEALIIFPAGFVNRFSFLQGLKDSEWKVSFLKIAQKTQTPILPIKVKGRNSLLFYIASFLLPKHISGLLLMREFVNAGKQKALNFTIGKVIPPESFANKAITTQEYLQMFYKHLYTLEKNKGDILKTEITIGAPKNKKMLKDEVQRAEYLGETADGKMIILADAKHSPFLLRELGRVREISFRAIGGGTGQAHDNDLYDQYYKHLILWDSEELEIVGAYRIGECEDIIKDKGREGLYTYNLCTFSNDFQEYCGNSVELGRSFVQPKYWSTRALDNLWQGVGAYLAHNPKIKYTYGTVTINANTPKKAVAALVYFYSTYFSCSTHMMQAKTPYVMSDASKEEFDILFEGLSYKEGFVVLKKYLKELNTSVPTLFKQYTELYEDGAVRFFDFSVNESLFGVVEGFIIADNSRMKKEKRKRYIESYEKLKTIDKLTGLSTKAHFCEQLSTMLKYKRKTDTNTAVVVLELDENEINESLLVKAANVLKRSLRDDDLIGRYDTQKLIFALKNVAEDDLDKILKKLKMALKLECSFNSAYFGDNDNLEQELCSIENNMFAKAS